MYFLSFRIFEQLALALKNRVARKFFAVGNILFTFRIFEQLAFALKNRGCPEFTKLNVFFFLFRIFEQLALAMKNRGCPEMFGCIEYIFYYSGVLSNLRFPWKQSCPGIFHCIQYTFYIQNFWATCACPEKQRVPWIYCIECKLLIIQNFWATCMRLPWKQSCPGIFTVLKYILLFRIFEQLALALKTEFALKFFKPGVRLWPNCGCISLINKPTRFSKNCTPSLLDHIDTNTCNEKRINNAGITIYDISDHLLVFVNFNCTIQPNRK